MSVAYLKRWEAGGNSRDYVGNYQVTVPCLGQTALSPNSDNKTFTTDWVAGTLDYDPKGGKWSCSADEYLTEKSG